MLDDLKKEQQAGIAAKERLKLSLYVGGLLLMGVLIYMGTASKKIQSKVSEDPSAATIGEVAAPAPAPVPVLEPAELQRLVATSGMEPDRWSVPGIEYLRKIRRTGRIGPVTRRLDPAALWTLDPTTARGESLDLSGRVVAISRETYGTDPDDDSGRIWSVILEGADGTQVIACSYALRSEVAEGPPADTRPPGVRAERIQVGQTIIARGVYLQRRTGTLGEIQLRPETPALFTFHYRIVVPPDQRNPLISALDEALWSEVRDRFNRESRTWDEDALFEVIQWARAQGYEKCREAVLNGELGWSDWGADRFKAWKDEVRVDEDDPRPVTEGSRGKVFRVAGIVGEVLDFGWERIPRNPWGVDEFQVVTLLADHYLNVSLRMFLPYPIDTFKDVEGTRAEHIRVYGVYIKNLTYDTKHKRADDSGRAHPVTAPMFVVLHAEPYPDDIAQQRMRSAMAWVAGGMLIFGLLFYFVLIRGSRRQNRDMEQHRLALRRRIRAKGQGPKFPAAPPSEGDGEDALS